MQDYKTILSEMKKVCLGVSSNIYTSSRRNTSDGVTEFIICSLPARIYDLAAYGQTVCRFSLYAKDISGLENYTVLSQMESALKNNLPINNSVCAIWAPETIPGGTDKSGFHVLHIQCNLIIY